MPLDIDQLLPTRNLIDLTNHSDGDFGLQEYSLSSVMGDIILVEFVDESGDGGLIKRGSLFVHANATTKAWRKARVLLAGPEVKHCKEGDIVIFPNDRGVTVAGINLTTRPEPLKRGMFLNEARLFGICKPAQSENAAG